MAKRSTMKNFHDFLEEIRQTEGLPENLSTEAQLWDEALKKEVFVMPEQVFPLIEEIYGKHYEKGTPIEPLATEFSVERGDTGKITSIRADVTVLIDKNDIYHFEAEIEYDGTMVLRMFEYDVHLALSYSARKPSGRDGESQMTLEFPYSAVLYLQDNRNIPDYLACKIRFQDGGEYTYTVPAFKVQSYSLEDIEKKHLSILTPFLPLRFRKAIVKDKESGKVFFDLPKEELTSFYQELILMLDREVGTGQITEHDRSVLLSLLRKSMIRVFYQDEFLIKEVVEMTEPILELEIEKYIRASDEAEKKFWQAFQKLERTNQELEDATQELEDKNQELEDKNQELEETGRKLEDVTQELEDKNQKLEDKNQELEETSRKLEDTATELERYREESLKDKETIALQQNDLEALQRQMEELQKQMETLQLSCR